MTLTTDQTAKQKSLYNKMVDKPKERPSRLDMQAAHLPGLKDMEVGKEYEIKVKAKMVSKSEGGYDGKQPLQGSFQIGQEPSYDDCVECD